MIQASYLQMHDIRNFKFRWNIEIIMLYHKYKIVASSSDLSECNIIIKPLHFEKK